LWDRLAKRLPSAIDGLAAPQPASGAGAGPVRAVDLRSGGRRG
jgi:hypothetical protein